MAVLDPERGAVVIRIVYDGPPHAGKTTSVRALARSLARHVETPLEAEGRTLFFDWMEYTGGLFEGHQIRCQIVTVPGQPDFAARRRALLETADVVIFVADTADRDSVARSVEHIRQMADMLGAKADPPIGIIVQANKRDLPTAVARDELAAAIAGDATRAAITESIADAGLGVRETFVLAVRVALDRIRELMARGALPAGAPATDSAEQLLALLERLPAPGDDLTAAELDAEALIQPDGAGAADARAREAPPKPGDGFLAVGTGVGRAIKPRLPDARVPSGAVWPPVEGRLVLHEAVAPGLSLHRVNHADWIAGTGTSWRIHSAAGAIYERFDAGHQALLDWARLHAAYGELLSPSRCVVLADDGNQAWRLWQIIKLAPSLRSWIADAAALDAGELFHRLTTAAMLLGEAHARCAQTRLLATLDSIGRGAAGAQFVALMPSPHGGPPQRPPDVSDRITRELSRMLELELAARHAELAAMIDRSEGWRTPWDDLVAHALARAEP
ncbi:MAG TPA: GTPase domain-containing protein [Kofleriaceae bacterium]|nr:GTPase domain-containing protein [Kofleriaceae bacterium]